MEDRFDSAFQKIKRARKHVDDLEAEVDTFLSCGPCRIDEVGPSASAAVRYKVASIDKLPAMIPLMVGDAAHNIRSALDHFAFAAVPNPGRNTYFPIWGKPNAPSPTEWQRTVDLKLLGASRSLLHAVQQLELWETGDHSHMWALHELDRIDKHRLLISLAAANNLIILEGEGYDYETIKKYSGYAQDRPLAMEPMRWIPLKEGTILFDAEGFTDFGITGAKFSLAVTLGEPNILRGQVAVSQLRGLATAAENLIASLAMLA
jgi:hypothetical protein